MKANFEKIRRFLSIFVDLHTCIHSNLHGPSIQDERRKSFVEEGEKCGLLKREKYGWLNTKLL